jgi:hypothetical protein
MINRNAIVQRLLDDHHVIRNAALQQILNANPSNSEEITQESI